METLESVVMLNGHKNNGFINNDESIYNEETGVYYNSCKVGRISSPQTILVKYVKGEWFECELKEVLALAGRKA